MTDKDNSKGLDIFGITPIGEAVNTVVKRTLDGATAFLSKICMPAAEEFGLLIRDRVTYWRAINLANIAKKTEQKLKEINKIGNVHAHPRLVSLVVDEGSWIDADEVQEMWAGLLASSCTEDGRDESNLIFMNLLSQLTSLEVKLLNFACKKAKMEVDVVGLVTADFFKTTQKELIEVGGIKDVQRIDRELDHLNALDLIEGTFGLDADEDEIDPSIAYIYPTSLGINLYVRCQGSLLAPAKFFKLTE